MESLFSLSSPVSNSKQPRWMRTNVSSTAATDRFIPSRHHNDSERKSFMLQSGISQNLTSSSSFESTCNYQKELEDCLFRDDDSSVVPQECASRILAFKGKAPERKREDVRNYYSSKPDIKSSSGTLRQNSRYISPTPERVLDAPEMLDDYYLNLLDWSSKNILAVALNSNVYLWNASTGSVEQLLELENEDYVCSVNWSQDGSYLAVGTSDAQVQLWDVESMSKARTLQGHSSRVGATSWNQHVLSSGSRDGSIIHSDVRIAAHEISNLKGHGQEICGLKWSPDGSQLASGGNDNILNIWDGISNTDLRYTLTHHRAAVKALAWCPWQPHLLASGGGSYDRNIRFWNTLSGTCVSSIDTGSQVCQLLWSKESREIVSSHGYTDNQLTVWNYPSMTKVTELYGHSSRVLHLALSPDGETVVSGAADENLKFWRIFNSKLNGNSNFGNVSNQKSETPVSKLESKLSKVIR